MKRETYTRRPAAKVKGTCKVCAHPRIDHTFAWPIGCQHPGCNCPHVFVEVPTSEEGS